MNPLACIANILSIRKEIPPVYVSYIEPLLHRLPKELSNTSPNGENEYFLASFLGIENLSCFVLKNIRIKLKSPLKYHPQIRTGRQTELINHTYDQNKNEITIEALDPDQSIYLDLYPTLEKIPEHFEPSIIINDQILTRNMKRYGYIIKHPTHAGLFFTSTALLFIAAAAIIYNWTSIIANNDEQKIVNDAVRKLGQGCYGRMVHMGDSARKLILSSSEASEMAIRLNGVKTTGELERFKKIILCVPDGYIDKKD